MSPLEGFPSTTKSPVPLLGHQRGAIRGNSGLYAGPPVLGREVQPTYLGQPCLLAGEYPGVEGSDGVLCLLPK